QQRGLLDMPGEHLQELRIQAGAPHRQREADQPQCQAWQPQLQAQADHGRQGPVDDRHVAWRTAQPERLGERAVQRHLEAEDEFELAVHATTAPPAKLKKLRKNEDAAKAIDRPKAIWISLRKPPLVSPKASVRPVVMMMNTAMMRATGPCTESRIDCSGPSQGMPEPAASTGREAPRHRAPSIKAPTRRRRLATCGWQAVMAVFLSQRRNECGGDGGKLIAALVIAGDAGDLLDIARAATPGEKHHQVDRL